MRLKFNLGGWNVGLSLSAWKAPNTWTKGVFNRCRDGKYIPFWDYDFLELEDVVCEVKHLQEVFNLGNLYVFRSGGKGFHVVGFDKLFAHEFMELLMSSGCDEAFKNVPRFASYRNWVLRNFSKGSVPMPEYVGTLRQVPVRKLSNAHYLYFKELYGDRIEKQINLDDSKDVSVIKYKTHVKDGLP